jgi:hypothetical protein
MSLGSFASGAFHPARRSILPGVSLDRAGDRSAIRRASLSGAYDPARRSTLPGASLGRADDRSAIRRASISRASDPAGTALDHSG